MSSKSLSNMKSEPKDSSSVETNDNINSKLSEMSDILFGSIDDNIGLLKPTIDFSKFFELIPDLKKVPNNQMVTETDINSKMNEFNLKLVSAEEEANDVTNESNDYHLFADKTKRLEQLFPTFKRIVDSFEDKCDKQSDNQNNCFDRKPIDLNQQKLDQLVKTGQQIQHFQQIEKHLKSLDN